MSPSLGDALRRQPHTLDDRREWASLCNGCLSKFAHRLIGQRKVRRRLSQLEKELREFLTACPGKLPQSDFSSARQIDGDSCHITSV